MKKKIIFDTKTIVRVAIFGAVAGILYVIPILSFNIPLFPFFLKFHFDEIPLLIAGFAYGPWVALAATFIRALIKLPFDIGETLGVGVLADLLFSIAFVVPASIIYKHKRTFVGALIGIGVGTFCQLVVAIFGNVYAMIPFYLFLYGIDEASMLNAINGVAIWKISDLKWSYAFIAVLPFNAIKDAIVIIVTLLVYKPLRRVINKVNEKPAR